MTVNFQRWSADDLATRHQRGLQILPFFGQLLIRPDVNMFQVPLQLELKRLKSNGNGSRLGGSEFHADEHSTGGQVDPMVDARRRNCSSFDHLPHFIHQAKANLAISFILNAAADTVQVEPNGFFNDLKIHGDTCGLRRRRSIYSAVGSLTSMGRRVTFPRHENKWVQSRRERGNESRRGGTRRESVAIADEVAPN
jgi:hypothetical protein